MLPQSMRQEDLLKGLHLILRGQILWKIMLQRLQMYDFAVFELLFEQMSQMLQSELKRKTEREEEEISWDDAAKIAERH